MTAARAQDPGWGPVLRVIPLMLIPVVGMRMMSRHQSGLFSMRVVWLAFVNALTLIWIVVVFVGDLDGSLSETTALIVTGVVGMAVQLIAPRFTPPLDFVNAKAFVTSYQKAFFIRVAFAEIAGLLGFVCFILSGSMLPYGLGYVVAMAGMWDAAPRAQRFAEAQYEADRASSGIDVIAALDGVRLTR